MAINLQPGRFSDFAEKLKEIPEDQADIKVIFMGANEETLKKAFSARRGEQGRNMEAGFMDRQISLFPKAILAAARAPFNCDLYVRPHHNAAPELLLSATDDGEITVENVGRAVMFFKGIEEEDSFGREKRFRHEILKAYKGACKRKAEASQAPDPSGEMSLERNDLH